MINSVYFNKLNIYMFQTKKQNTGTPEVPPILPFYYSPQPKVAIIPTAITTDKFCLLFNFIVYKHKIPFRKHKVLTFLIWLLFLFARFVYIVAYSNSSFNLTAAEYSIKWICQNLSILFLISIFYLFISLAALYLSCSMQDRVP